MSCLATTKTGRRNQSSSPTCVNIHWHWVSWGWFNMRLCQERSWDGLSLRTEVIGEGDWGTMSRSEGFIRSSVLVYVLSCFIPRSRSNVGGSSVCHCCYCILYLWVKAPSEFDY